MANAGSRGYCTGMAIRLASNAMQLPVPKVTRGLLYTHWAKHPAIIRSIWVRLLNRAQAYFLVRNPDTTTFKVHTGIQPRGSHVNTRSFFLLSCSPTKVLHLHTCVRSAGLTRVGRSSSKHSEAFTMPQNSSILRCVEPLGIRNSS